MRCPTTLDDLWAEYEFRICGSKPAKLFTATERAKVKFYHSLKKPFWELVERMIRYEYSHTAAI